MSTKKAAGTSFIRCPPLVGGIYTVSPGEHHNWIFASEGLYSLCVNSYHRTYYLFTSLATLRENGCKITIFPATSKIFPVFLQISTFFRSNLCLNWGIRRNCRTPSKKTTSPLLFHHVWFVCWFSLAYLSQKTPYHNPSRIQLHGAYHLPHARKSSARHHPKTHR